MIVNETLSPASKSPMNHSQASSSKESSEEPTTTKPKDSKSDKDKETSEAESGPSLETTTIQSTISSLFASSSDTLTLVIKSHKGKTFTVSKSKLFDGIESNVSAETLAFRFKPLFEVFTLVEIIKLISSPTKRLGISH